MTFKIENLKKKIDNNIELAFASIAKKINK